MIPFPPHVRGWTPDQVREIDAEDFTVIEKEVSSFLS